MTKIFLDSGDPQETKTALTLLGHLDGQTTNPSLFAKNPAISGKKFTQEQIYEEYKKIVQEISGLIPQGSVSIEVYADKKTTSAAMIAKAQEMNTWIPNAHIKLPITTAGLTAAEALTKQDIKLNLTLCFSEEQAAAVYNATKGAKVGDVFLSPFIGRLDDKGINGLDLIKNIQALFNDSDHHVSVLAASIRTLNHLNACLAMNSDIVTAPLNVYQEWKKLQPINKSNLNLNQSRPAYNLQHELTDAGLEKFASDWNQLI